MDFEAEGLLEGLDGDARRARERLLTRLVQDGFSAEELRRAVAQDRLALLPVDRILGGNYSADEVQGKTGFDPETLIRARRLLGLPEVQADERVFSDEDIEAARSMQLFLDAGFDPDEIVEITRVLGEGMARLAATITASFTDTFLSAGDSEEDVAERFAPLAEQLTPALTPVLVAAFRDHLRDSVSRGVLGRAELESGEAAGAQELAICFADLVGFTRLGGQLELRELGTVAGQLARLAASVTQSPVRLIKTIGDAAMFVSPEAGPLVQVALDLVAAVEAAELPSLRAGIALGPAVIKAGDFYGPSVNLASRVTGVARPGTVLCTQEVHDAAGDGELGWSAAGKHRLKGITGPVPLFRARPKGDNGSQSPESAERSQDSENDDGASPKRRAGRSRRRGRH